MKVLIINIDKNIFEPGSKSLERLKEYAGFCDKLSAVVLTRRRFAPIIVGNLSVFATGSCCRAKYSLDALRLAKKIMAEEKYDLVMTQDPFDTGHIGWLIKRKYKISWQCQIHVDFLSPYFWQESLSNKFRVLAAKFLLPNADGVRAVSQRIKKSIISEYRNIEKSKIIVLPIFVDLDKIKNSPVRTDLRQKYPQFSQVILTAARLSREKNLGLTVEAMEEIVKHYPKAGLIIVGAGRQQSNLKSKIADLKLTDNVIMEGWSDDLASYYKTADLFLVTSNYEGWSMALVEALGAGCPVVTTDVGCAGELIKDGQSGLVVAVGDKVAVAGAIVKALSLPDLAQSLASGGREALRSLPTKEQYLSEYKKSWEAIL